MKRSRFALLLSAVCGISLLLNSIAGAQERKPMAAIDTDGLTGDTQISAPCGSDHMNLIWAIPVEFWKAAFASDPSMTPAQSAEIIGALEEYVIIGIVQADIGDAGQFDFYSEDEVRGALNMSFTDADGKAREIVPTNQVGLEAQQLLAALKPMLSAAMGNMGQNLHFIVINDDAGESGRTWDPYAPGVLAVDLKTRAGKALEGRMEGPINALFVPRKCSNGKDAHVTWKFCPWTGEELK
jgi:hypothetical protein